MVISVKCVKSEYNHCVAVYIVEPGDENNGDWVNAMQSEEAGVEEELIEFLRRNIDVFAWNAYEAPGVDRASSAII